MKILEVITGIERQIEATPTNDLLPNKFRPCLTLRHLHELRKMRERQAVERSEHLELIQAVYGADTECEKDGKRKKSMKPVKAVKTVKAFKLVSPNKK